MERCHPVEIYRSVGGVNVGSDDELDEFDALTAAGEQGDVVIAADVDADDTPVGLDRVASFHFDADGSGDMAWYAPQELDEVIELLRS